MTTNCKDSTLMGKIAKRSAAIAVVVTAIAGAGVAFAAWTSNGTGTGTATAGTSTPLTITQSASATGLFPTGSVNVPFTISNSNPYAVTLTGATATNVTSDIADCNAAASVTGGALTLTDRIPAGGTVSKTMVVSMSNAANDDCQGATFTFDINVSGASSS